MNDKTTLPVKKYRLLKDLPDVKAGAFFKIGAATDAYYLTSDLTITKYNCYIYPIQFVENNPDWFEPVIEQPDTKEKESRIEIKVLPYGGNGMMAFVCNGTKFQKEKIPEIKSLLERYLNNDTGKENSISKKIEIQSILNTFKNFDGTQTYEIKVTDLFPPNSGEKIKDAIERVINNIEDELTIQDYKDVIDDNKRLVKELDIIINGKNAAENPSLCDLVSQLKQLNNDTEVEINGKRVHYELGENGVPNIISIAGYIFYPALNAQKTYTQSELEEAESKARKETWEAARERHVIPKGNGHLDTTKYPTLSDYLSSLNSKEEKPEQPSTVKDKEQEVLFTTIDGVPVYKDGWAFYVQDDNNWMVVSHSGISEKRPYPYFSTKEAANNWVLENKPCLSLNDVKLISEIHGVDEKIRWFKVPLYDLKYSIQQKLKAQ